MSFDINLSTREARAEIDRLSAKIVTLSRNADMASSRMRSALGGSMGGARQLKNIEAGIKGINQNLINMNAQWQKASTVAASSGRRLNKSVNKQRKQFRRSKLSADDYGEALLTVSQKAAVLRSGMLAMGTHVGIFSARTLLAATATYALVKAIRMAVTVGAEYTRSLATTAAIIGTSREQLEGLSREQLRLAETTKFTTTEVAAASTILAKTGLKTIQVTEALPAILNLAAIGVIDMSKAADIAANSMFGFQLGTKDLTGVVDTLAFTATNSNTTIQQLGNALSFAAPVSAAAGAKFEEVSALLGTMADSGIKASKAGTTLRRAYVNLLDPGRKAAKVLDDLGLTIKDRATGQLRSLVDIMEEFARANGNATDLVKIFGVRAAPGMISVWKDLAKGAAGGTSKTREFLRTLDKEGAGAGERMRNAMEKNLIDVWLKFKSVVSVKATEAFFLIEDSLISLVKNLTHFVKVNVNVGSAIDQIVIHFSEWKRLITNIPKNIDAVSSSMTHLSRGLKQEAVLFSKNMGFIKTALLDLPANIEAVVRLATIRFAQIAQSAEIVPLHLIQAWTKFKFFFSVMIKEVSLTAVKGFDFILDTVSTKLFSLSDMMANLPGTSALVKKVNDAASAFNSARSQNESADALAKEVALRDKNLSLINKEIQAVEDRLKIQAQVADQMTAEIFNQRDATLASRDASLKQLSVEKQRIEAAARMKRERESFSVSSGQVEVGIGRVLPDGPKQDLLGTSERKLKDFIKLQKLSVTSTIDQIKHLEKMRQIGPFEALNAGIEVSNNSLKAMEGQFVKLIKPLLFFQKTFKEAGFKSLSEEYSVVINKVIKAYATQTDSVKKGAREQRQALEMLRSQFELVASSSGDFIQKARKPLGAAGAVDFLTSLRQGAESPLDKIDRQEAEKLAALTEAEQRTLQMLEGQHALQLASEQQFQDFKTQIQADAERARLELTVQTFQKEAKAEQSFHLARASALVQGFQALSQEGSKTSRSLFKLNKAARVSQILVDTPAAVSGAYTWGASIGGPLAGAAAGAVALLNQGALLKQAKGTTFGGGGTASSGASSAGISQAAPAPAPVIPPASDAIFNQTSAGQTANTVDSSNRGAESLSVTFKIEAFDAQGVDRVLARKRNAIVGMVQEAYNERGVRGGPRA